MPLVLLSRDPAKVYGVTYESFLKSLPEIVAKALGVSDTEGALTPGDVTVWTRDFGKHDIHEKDLEIIIWAISYPERQKNLEARKNLICRTLRLMMPESITGFVFILLQPGSFGEF